MTSYIRLKLSGLGILKHASLLAALRLLPPVLTVALVLAVSRSLGTDGLGRYTLVLAFHGFFAMISPLGLNGLLMREGARDEPQVGDLTGHAMLLGIGSSLVLAPLMAMAGFAFGYDAETTAALALASVALVPSTLQTYIESVLIARQRTEYLTISTCADVALRVGLGLAAVAQGYSILAVIGAFVAGQTCAAAIGLVLLKRAGVVPVWHVQRSLVVHLLKTGPTFCAISVFATLYWRIDIMMLAVMSDLTNVGLYGAAYRFMEIAKTCPHSICLAIYPAVCHAAAVDRDRLRSLGSSALRFLWVVTVPMAVGITILAKPVLLLTVGDEFTQASTVLIVLFWTIVPYSLVRYYAFVLVAAGRQRVDLWLNVTMSFVNAALNLMLIPRYGALGAAVATLVSIVLYAIGQCWYLRRTLPDHLAESPAFTKPLIAAAVMGLFVWWYRDVQVLVVVTAAVFVYVAVLLLNRDSILDELRVLGADRAPWLRAAE